MIFLLSAAAGLLIGWAAGSATVSRRAARRRATETIRQHQAMVSALSRTAQPNKGNK